MQNTNTSSSERIFTFEINNSTSIIIEDFNKKNNSIFKDIYNRVFDTIEKTFNTNVCFNKNEYPNNIFAIIGDRGTGKSSCMHSIAKMLSDNKEHSVFPSKNGFSLHDRSFEVIESTDPSFFDDKKNILDIFLGHLFSNFNEKVRINASKKINEKNEVLQNFENVKNALACMEKKSICEDCSVDQLIDLSASVDLKESINKLIKSYLKYIEKDYLVIPIDDIDLHTIYAYNMAEQIRKYLAQPQTIVLIALKIEQLEYAIERHYLKHYNTMLDKNFLQNSNISDMAIKYLIKFIPQSHRFPLKTIDELLNEDVIITNNGNYSNFKEHNLKDIITGRIFEKTRFLFYNHPNEISPIIPRNLRECRYLLEFLILLDDYSDDNSGKYNQQQFMNFFIDYCGKIIDTKDQTFLKTLISNSTAKDLNLSIIRYLDEKFIPNTDEEYPRRRIPQRRSPFFELTDIRNTPYNVSTGDVMAVIQHFESKNVQERDAIFIFAIKTLYSMQLYHFYNEKTNKKSFDEEISPSRNSLDKVHNYDKLVGGAFFSEADRKIEDHFRKSNISKCQQEIRRIISLNNLKKMLDEALDTNGNIINIEYFKTIEFFALTISRSYSFGNDYIFRTRDDAVYDKDDLSRTTYVWFDIFSAFFNTTRIEECYNRIDSRLYKIASKEKDSLLNKIKQICFEEKKYCKDYDHACLSCCSIRNIDVLENIKYNLIKTPLGKDGLETIKNILDVCQNFKIGTYDSDEKNNRYKITFRFANILFDYISNIDKKTFEIIYNHETNNTIKFKETLNNIISYFTLFDDANNSQSKTTKQSRKNSLNGIKFQISRLGPSKDQIEEKFNEHFDDIDDITDDDNISEFISALEDFMEDLNDYPIIA